TPHFGTLVCQRSWSRIPPFFEIRTTTFPLTRSTPLISHSWQSSSKASNLPCLSSRSSRPARKPFRDFRLVRPSVSGLLDDTGLRTNMPTHGQGSHHWRQPRHRT